MRIGVNGGTFDPIHFGHLRPALEVLESLALDEMRFIPACQPVHRGTPSVAASHRVRMVELAIAPQPRFVLDRREIDRGGPSYMVETLESVKRDFPTAELVLMMGADAIAAFTRWHRWQDILKLANIVVTRRPGAENRLPDALALYRQNWHFEKVGDPPLHFDAPAGKIGFLPVTQLDISATAIRARLAAGRSVRYLTPETVVEYIDTHQLYRKETHAG
ncbi:nicotinate-nucleotide adenylyltransferase [Sulfurivirga caldicuralii]|uniref:Probable nicotinate-nucleotide adenylyltransferase n=1 Tax=Sulfurivirga caldicuralii TaxID=364032 RepID=A0A1N6DPV1_9GAMM|nr:nicotinate-nucleotide adenylyltransferase [Sulfurivirga caldicuralii]SIN72776.1 nicotinate-nucleotide adenylyltransferase [Sulfurivirga caldicuralii]